jgi:hypothetical protein
MQYEPLTIAGAAQGAYSSLCQSDQEKSCFFCCPPLRSPGYDPWDAQDALAQRLTRNRQKFPGEKDLFVSGRAPSRPIVGWDCWGLGFLDHERARVGCLLHPCEHQGRDLRFLVEYEGKCGRELCLEARTFETLQGNTREFYRSLTRGMDSFEYSSPSQNPLFAILRWGTTITEKIAEAEAFLPLSLREFSERYEALLSTLSYKIDGYLLEQIVDRLGVLICRDRDFLAAYQGWKDVLLAAHRAVPSAPGFASGRKPHHRPVHIFPIPLSFSRLLKFGLDIWYGSEEQVAGLRDAVDQKIDRFVSNPGTIPAFFGEMHSCQ